MLRTILVSGLATALLSTTTLAADLPTKKEAPAFVPPAQAVSWTGFYVGVNGGYGGDQYRYSLTPVGVSAHVTSSGFLGGGQIGYNLQFAPSWVGGLEADLDAADIKGQVGVNFGGPITAGSKTNYLGTVRPRLGYLVTDHFLAFATGGLAYGDTVSGVSGVFNVSKTNSQVGWTVGGGVEYMLAKNWTFKTEYLYTDLGSASIFSGGGFNLKVHTTDNIVRAGLNYLFN